MGADVIRALGLSQSRSNYTTLSSDEIRPLGRGLAHAKLISESALYKLIMRSTKPEAKAFQDWVTREVLPAINEDGTPRRPWETCWQAFGVSPRCSCGCP